MGYLGGGLLFALNVAMTLKPALFGLADASAAVRASFVMVGIWWLVFALPCVLWVHERESGRAWPRSPRCGRVLAELRGTLRAIRRYKPILWFLAAYWLYIDGVNTVIKMAVDYGLSLGFEASSLVAALLLTQFVAFPPRSRSAGSVAGSAHAGASSWRSPSMPRRPANAYFIRDVSDFFVLAVVVGLVQGGVQSLSRSYFGRLVPEGKSSEFFGFYNMMGKFAAVIGPLLTAS